MENIEELLKRHSIDYHFSDDEKEIEESIKNILQMLKEMGYGELAESC